MKMKTRTKDKADEGAEGALYEGPMKKPTTTVPPTKEHKGNLDTKAKHHHIHMCMERTCS